MQDAVIEIVLNSVTTIPVHEYDGFKIISSIKEGLPYGYLKIGDSDAGQMAAFENFQIGSRIKMTIINTQDELDFVELPEYYILNIEADFATNPSLFAGSITIWFGHPWFLYKDSTNHVYSPQNSSELIKKVLKDETRGIAFNVENKNFNDTDDTERDPWLKINETDWEFIQHKILPYITISHLPVHFYCDDRDHKFHLNSFMGLYKENPTIIFHQSEEHLGEQENRDAIDSLCDRFNITKGEGHYALSSANIKIGNEDCLREIFPHFCFEGVTNNSFVEGSKQPGNKLRSRKGTVFGDIMPLDLQYIMNTNSSSAKVVRNRTMLSSLAYLFETSKVLEEMFILELITNFTKMQAIIGDTAELYVAPTPEVPENKSAGNKTHWIAGRWLINKIEHYSNEDQKTQLMTKTTLVRPNFVGDEKTTSLTKGILMHRS